MPCSRSYPFPVAVDARGRFPTARWMRTALPGVFAAGDVRAYVVPSTGSSQPAISPRSYQ